MRQAARQEKPLLEAADPQSDLQQQAERMIPENDYPVTAGEVLKEDEIILFQQEFPDVLDVRFRSRKQAEWALRDHLEFLRTGYEKTPRNLLNQLINDAR